MGWHVGQNGPSRNIGIITTKISDQNIASMYYVPKYALHFFGVITDWLRMTFYVPKTTL